ncbi:MAG: hypothetical protein GQ525_11510 [Draconibacterium sp.]|nr:hypothetical protein [Draconibacterium sp.]
MKNKGIVIFLIVLAVVIVGVIVGDFISKRPDKMAPNPFDYNLDEFKNVDESLIHYKETKNFKIGFEEPAGITLANEKIYLVGDKKLKIIDFAGKLLSEIELFDKPHTVEVADDKIYVAFEKQIQVFDEAGELLQELNFPDDNSYITAVAIQNENIFVADAGTRKIMHFTLDGEKLNEFDGKTDEEGSVGFIIPSPYFDMDINEDGELWLVNPGMHSLENFNSDGSLRTYWKSTSVRIEGFSGCCNPAHFTFLPDGSFVTSEKGLVRIKIYKPSGEFSGVVAAPNKFVDKIEGQAPDIEADELGNIYALDFDKKVLRVFELK